MKHQEFIALQDFLDPDSRRLAYEAWDAWTPAERDKATAHDVLADIFDTLSEENDVPAHDVTYRGFKLFKMGELYSVGGSDNADYSDCTLENLGSGVDESEMVQYCFNKGLCLFFDDLRGNVSGVSYAQYLSHLEKYQTCQDDSFLDNEFIVPVVRFASTLEAKEFIDWIHDRRNELEKSGKPSLGDQIQAAAGRTKHSCEKASVPER